MIKSLIHVLFGQWFKSVEPYSIPVEPPEPIPPIPTPPPKTREIKPMELDPMPYLEKSKRDIDMLVIHCTATHPYMDIGVKEVRKWHTDPKPRGRGWVDIGYTALIRFNGDFEKGRSVHVAGAHAFRYNARSIGIAFVGGLDNDKRPSPFHYTKAQWRTLKAYVKEFKAMYPNARIVGHNELGSGKACPSFDVAKWLLDGSIVAVD